MRRIKVLHLTSTRYGIGGVEKLLLDMSDKYDSAKFEVSYCNLFCDAQGKGVFPTALRNRGLKFFQINGNTWRDVPSMSIELLRLLKSQRFDIVHLHMLQATIVGGFATKFARGSRVVVTKHYTDDMLKQSSVVKRLDNLFTKRANRIAAISNNVKRDMVDLGIPEAKIKVIYNGTDIRKFDARAQEKSTFTVGKEADPFLIGTVGSLTERKGHRYLLEAMPAILKKNSNVHLIVIGEGPEKEMLEKLRGELRLESAITMLGFQENVAPILKQMDVYVHPSVHEPFGIAVLEAMAAAKCVVATAVGGVPEIVSPGVTGYLVRAESSRELSSAISATLEERENTLKMGENGRSRVSEMFDIDVTVRGYESLYQEII